MSLLRLDECVAGRAKPVALGAPRRMGDTSGRAAAMVVSVVRAAAVMVVAGVTVGLALVVEVAAADRMAQVVGVVAIWGAAVGAV